MTSGSPDLRSYAYVTSNEMKRKISWTMRNTALRPLLDLRHGGEACTRRWVSACGPINTYQMVSLDRAPCGILRCHFYIRRRYANPNLSENRSQQLSVQYLRTHGPCHHCICCWLQSTRRPSCNTFVSPTISNLAKHMAKPRRTASPLPLHSLLMKIRFEGELLTAAMRYNIKHKAASW
jgi:hypothetical protein